MKCRTTIYISPGTKRVIKQEKINLSQWVEDKVTEMYGEGNSPAVITQKILEQERQLQDLREFRVKMESEIATIDRFVFQMAANIRNPEKESIRSPEHAIKAYELVINDSPILSQIPKKELIRRVHLELEK